MISIKKILYFLYSIFPLIVIAQDYCNQINVPYKHKVELPLTPEYFFKTLLPTSNKDSRNEASLIFEGFGNTLLDLETGIISNLPGPLDAVPSVDGKIITVPGNEGNNNSFEIYRRDDTSKPVLQDSGEGALVGVYQSVGHIESSSTKETYRVITDVLTTKKGKAGNNLMYKEYTNTQHHLFKGTTKRRSMSNLWRSNMPESKPLCSNILTPMKLPMLSKSGRMLAAYDVKSGTSHIYQISKDNEGNSVCKSIKDLGVASTKVEFSPDDTKITFAADSLKTQNHNVIWHAQPGSKSMNFNVFVLDLETNKIKQVSYNSRGNSYYPSFSRDNTVTFLQQEVNQDNNQIKYFLVQKEIDFIQSFNFNSINCNSYKQDQLMALGWLWHNTCSILNSNKSDRLTKLGAISAFNRIPKEGCLDFINDTYSKISNLNKISLKSDNTLANDYIFAPDSFEKDDLIALCNQKPQYKKLITPEIKEGQLKGKFSNFSLVTRHCSSCHNAQMGRDLQFENFETVIKNADKAIEYIKSGVMPLGRELSGVDRMRLIYYFKQFISKEE